jgi:hypothetical protein
VITRATPVGASQARARRQVVPLEQEAQQRGGAHRLDLAPQPDQREPVDAGQDAAVAPLQRRHRVVAVGGPHRVAHAGRHRRAAVELAAQDGAVALEREQRAEHLGRGQAELGRQGGRGDWPAMVELAGDDADQRLFGLGRRGRERRDLERRRQRVGRAGAVERLPDRAEPLDRAPARRLVAGRDDRRSARRRQLDHPRRRLGRQRARAPRHAPRSGASSRNAYLGSAFEDLVRDLGPQARSARASREARTKRMVPACSFGAPRARPVHIHHLGPGSRARSR